jgi:hypothetical protein
VPIPVVHRAGNAFQHCRLRLMSSCINGTKLEP